MLSIALSIAIMSSFPTTDLTRLTDGDTFVVELPVPDAIFGKNVPVRIKGIDAPEMKAKRLCEKKDAQRAKAVLEEFVSGKKVELLFCEREKYWRLLCVVRVDGQYDAGEYMLMTGNAKLYDGGTKTPWKCFQNGALQ